MERNMLFCIGKEKGGKQQWEKHAEIVKAVNLLVFPSLIQKLASYIKQKIR